MKDTAELLKVVDALYPKTTEFTEEATLAMIRFIEEGIGKLSGVEMQHALADLRMLYEQFEKFRGKPPIKIEIPSVEATDFATGPELGALQMIFEAQQKNTQAVEDYYSAWGQGASNVEGIGQAILDNLKKQEDALRNNQAAIELIGSVTSEVFSGIGQSIVEGTSEGFVEAFKGQFVRLLDMLSTYSWAQVAASIFPLTGIPNPAAAAAWVGAALASATAAGAIQAMAEGGVLWEPVLGMGLNSGRRYLMGERGPEVVSRMGSGAGGTVTNIYNNVRGSIVSENEMYRGSLRYQQRALRTH